MTRAELNTLVAGAYNFQEGLQPIFDGVICEEEYAKSKYKILWILKEPYDHYGEGKGGWDGCADILQNLEGYFTIPTLRKMAITSYGILNNMDYAEVRNQPDVPQILKSIASINVSKYPANTTSPNRWKYLEETYKKTQNVLAEQIEYCNPDIIICGSVAYLFLKDFGLEQNDALAMPFMGRSYFKTDNRIIFDAKHPAAIMNQEEYCNEIISLTRNWLSEMGK
ncbi:hypothetical protein [Adhaeribacter rhizoryzae]|uniref:Uracil-DNA glycosylase-like domain-containing protein n=1 Tax=Adhaeribacter rhizoryzae TaxID=2607907 RepID=A0A5M6D486_9BACT|nr:hypothetical protein [Adhaeribacter rhizoryzae]KAA5542327.1 hypothetical protein F0145_19040 [Adhaeribacter rhizoryzae]